MSKIACLAVSIGFLAACSTPRDGTTAPWPDATAGADTRAPDASTSDSGNTDGPPDAATPPVASGQALLVTAQRGVSTPWFIPVGPAGPGEAVRLAPRRGAGYGLGEGEVSYPQITPDGQHVVVVFYPMATPSSSGSGDAVLFALSLDGQTADAPVRIGSAAGLHALDRAYRPGWMAWVDGERVFAGRLDGSDAEAPVLVTTAPEGAEISGLRWIGDDVLGWTERPGFSSNQRRVFTAQVTAEGVSPPAELLTSTGPAHGIGAELPGGRLVVQGGDSRLHVVTLDDPGVPVTPEGSLASLVGISSDGQRLVAELRVTGKEERELISAAADGSGFLTLTPAPIAGLSSVMSRDGAEVAWVGRSGGSWAAFASQVGAMEADPRISDWSAKRLHVTAFDAAHAALVGSREDGAVLRYTGRPGLPAPPVVLATVPDVVNHSIPWPTVSLDGSHVIYDANTPQGFQSWTVPLAGGPTTALPAPWYRHLVTARGVLTHEYVSEGAVARVDADGTWRPLTSWHGSALRDPHLLGDGTVLYTADAPSPGVYAAHSTATTPHMTLVMPGDPGNAQPQVVAGALIRLVDDQLLAFGLDGSDAEAPRVLATGAQGPVALDPAGRVLFTQAGSVWSVPADGSASPDELLATADQYVSHLSVHESTGQALVGLSGPLGSSLTVVPTTGGAPTVAATELPGWLMSVAPAAAHALSVHSIQPTAVPHPDALLATPLSPPTGAAHALAPDGFMLWGLEPWYDGAGVLPPVITSPDGAWVVLRGPDGLYTTRTDGSTADAPVLLGAATQPLGKPLSPDGLRLLLHQDGAVIVADLEQGSQDTLATPGSGLTQGAWTPTGEVVYLADGVVHRVAGGGSQALHDETFPAEALVLVLDDAVVVSSSTGGDHSLYRVPLSGENSPAPITPVDDVGERLIGRLP